MLPPLERPLAVLDLETTGTNVFTDRIVEVAAVKVHPDGRRESFVARVNPQQPIPAQATAVHGITDADVANAPKFAEVAPALGAFLAGCDLAGFGVVRFDVPLLAQEFRRVGIEWNPTQMRLLDAQRIFHLREPRDLTAAMAFYCGRPHEGAHSAVADTEAALQVLEAQFERYADLPRDVAELARLCSARDPDSIDAEGKLRWRDGEAVIAFGQKSGIKLRDMAANEPGYLRWMLNKDFSPEVKTVVRDALAGKFPTPQP